MQLKIENYILVKKKDDRDPPVRVASDSLTFCSEVVYVDLSVEQSDR